MKLNIYSIYDTASGLYLRPLFAQSDGEAVRAFTDAVADKETEYGKHPEDYTLIRLGIFENTSGNLTEEINSSLITGLEAVAKTRNVNKKTLDMFDQKTTIEQLHNNLKQGGDA